MNEVPDDLYACCYMTSRRNGKAFDMSIGAFLVRASSLEEATEKARDFSRQTCKRLGLAEPHVCVNEVSGEGAVVDLENKPIVVTPRKMATKYKV